MATAEAIHLDEESLLPFCPACAYPLRGLPVPHACPECGCKFDRRSLIFGGPFAELFRPAPAVVDAAFSRRRRLPDPKRLLLIVLGGWLAIESVVMLFLARGFVLRYLPCGAPLFLIGVWITWRGVHQSSDYVLVGPDGVQLCRGSRVLRSCPWSEVGAARYDLSELGAVLSLDGESLVLKTSRYFPFRVQDADACVAAINRLRDPEAWPASWHSPRAEPVGP